MAYKVLQFSKISDMSIDERFRDNEKALVDANLWS
jgi:hypothetical protein